MGAADKRRARGRAVALTLPRGAEPADPASHRLSLSCERIAEVPAVNGDSGDIS